MQKLYVWRQINAITTKEEGLDMLLVMALNRSHAIQIVTDSPNAWPKLVAEINEVDPDELIGDEAWFYITAKQPVTLPSTILGDSEEAYKQGYLEAVTDLVKAEENASVHTNLMDALLAIFKLFTEVDDDQADQLRKEGYDVTALVPKIAFFIDELRIQARLRLAINGMSEGQKKALRLVTTKLLWMMETNRPSHDEQKIFMALVDFDTYYYTYPKLADEILYPPHGRKLSPHTT